MKSASRIIPFPRSSKSGPPRHEVEFLPAALEIVETPPSPTARMVAFSIVALFCLALAWAYVGQVDMISSARGKIVPSGRTKTIQPYESGVIKAIYVNDGQVIHAGDKLIELDPTIDRAELDHIRADLNAAELDAARLSAALSDPQNPVNKFVAPSTSSPESISTTKEFLRQQTIEYNAKLAALDEQIAQKEAEKNTIAAGIGKLESVIPVIQQRLDIRASLLHNEFGSKVQYLEMLQMLVETQQDLNVQKSKYKEAEAAVAATREARAQSEAEYARKLHEDLAEAERKVQGLKNDILKGSKRAMLQQLTAPVDGTVQQLAVHTIGGVVTPAQPLMSVVPSGAKLQIEAMIPNRDIGFVHPGQAVEVKVDTFNFIRYGLLHGTLTSVSRDAITRDRPDDKRSEPAIGSDTASSEPKGQEMVYSARVSLDQDSVNVDGAMVKLTPGMAVTAEIKTGSQSILSYLMSPLLRVRSEALRER